MPKQLFIGLSVVLFMLSVAGCASSKANGGGITTRAYVADKERIDQNMEGNFGYVAGTPKPVDRSLYKKTRKVYVMEFTKEQPADEDVDTTTTGTSSTDSSASDYQAGKEAATPEAHGRTIDLPSFGGEERASREHAVDVGDEKSTSVAEGTEYTVEKDDTLQKISKKFYNTYSKWPKIYEANKNVIANPNRIKSGIKLVIPQ